MEYIGIIAILVVIAFITLCVGYMVKSLSGDEQYGAGLACVAVYLTIVTPIYITLFKYIARHPNLFI